MTPEELQLRVREIFRVEATELVAELEAALLELEETPGDTALINRVFRALHTLKGSGSTSGFPELSQFLHKVEDVFFAAREGRIAVEPAMVDRALAIKDVVPRYLAAAAGEGAAVLETARADLNALMEFLPEGRGTPAVPAPAARTAPAGPTRFKIHFAPKADLFRGGADPGMFLDDLRALGTCQVTASTTTLPALRELDPESCYLAWDIELVTDAGEPAIREIFAFIEDDCLLTVETVVAEVASQARQVWTISLTADESIVDSPGMLEGIWRDLRALGSFELHEQPVGGAAGCWRGELETDASVEVGRLRDVFIFFGGAAPEIVRKGTSEAPCGVLAAAAPRQVAHAPAPAALASAAPAVAKARQPRDEQLRVSAGKLDRLVDMVGELVILRALVGNACSKMHDVPAELSGASEGLDRLTKELRDVVLDIRMMPVGDTFATFRRLTRDLARDLGKEVDLVIEGADTEMDKTMLEQVKDPLVHLVRNCLDHGFELPDDREKAGKPRHGTLRLSAEQQGDRVCIIVADDGKGLDCDRIRAKAIERGLLSPDANPTEHEIHQMIFLAGFSTADRVSEVSGRGVGMDVVKRAVETLRGTIELTSRPGHGTAVKLSVPLTLAIIEGLMVGIDAERYILPLSIASETISFDPKSRSRANGRNLVELRRELIPYVDLRDLFRAGTTRPKEQRVVIVECEGRRVGLVVDAVYGNHQTVLKSLGWVAQHVDVFSGSTILGDGRVALIFDVPALVSRATESAAPVSALEV